MAKALVALVLCAILVAGVAAETGRSLQQDFKFDCDGANRISKVNNACNLLCTCAGGLDPTLKGKPQSEKDKVVNACKGTCGKCQEAGKTCKAGDGLPDACKEGQNNQWVRQCITTYLKAQG